MVMIEWIKDRWITWRTGKSKAERQWIAWYETNVVYRANTIPNMFMNFEHIIEVDSNKFMVEDPFAWSPCDDAKQYFWPARELGNNAVCKDRWDNMWHLDEMGGEDKVFVATNNSRDAVMIALKYS
jgi:hypothetical protein